MIVIKKRQIEKTFIVLLYSLTIAGYPLASSFSIILDIENRFISIPFRAAILGLSILIIIISVSKNRIYKGIYVLPLMLFWFLYTLRILSDTLDSSVLLHTNAADYYLIGYGMSFIPMLAFLTYIDTSLLKKSYLFTMLLAAVACLLVLIINYNAVIFGNIDNIVHGRLQTGTLDPISLGHLGATLTILCTYYFLYKLKSSSIIKISVGIFLILGVFVTILSASRGPFLALVIVLAAMFWATLLRGSILKVYIITFIIVALSSMLFYYSSEYLGLSSISRINSLASSDQDLTANIRLQMFSDAWKQFIDNPIFGSGLEEQNSGSYPHNLVIESFMSTGIIGGIVFCILILMSLWSSFRIILTHKELSWVAFLYGQYLISSMLSGSLYSGSILWCLMAAVIVLNHQYRRVKINSNYACNFSAKPSFGRVYTKSLISKNT